MIVDLGAAVLGGVRLLHEMGSRKIIGYDFEFSIFDRMLQLRDWLAHMRRARRPTALPLRVGFARMAYLKLLRTFSLSHIHHICFDQMLPKTAQYWRKDQAIALLEQAGLQDIEAAWVNEASWSVIGTKTT